MSPISPVLPGSPWAKAHLVLRIDQRLVEVAVEELSLRLNKREQIVEEVPVIRLTGFFPCPQSFCLQWSYLNSKQYRRLSTDKSEYENSRDNAGRLSTSGQMVLKIQIAAQVKMATPKHKTNHARG